MNFFAIVTVIIALDAADAVSIGGCNIAFKVPGGNTFYYARPTQVLTTQMLNSRGIRYHDNTKTFDTWRYAQTRNLPLTTRFTDSGNVKWHVTLLSRQGTCSMCVPGHSEMYFWGDERDRVGMDSTAQFMCMQFSYEPSGWWHSHGIRLRTEGFTDPNYANSDWDNWAKALDLVAKGADITSSLAQTGIAVAAVGRK